ncbi:hypothetical protein FIV06_31340 (plasmid) [Labrenzia sp. THAF191b]|nr:hypothetical protein FIV06_31340 [Labrenzia sp. THAF191b]QFT08310.1 hypothetical protein FIV05_31465 [Labrenzia sp. THAF191a]QFT19872.1 hypothetical protein FIV03_31570 [Labrenzia sp. THAF187b]
MAPEAEMTKIAAKITKYIGFIIKNPLPFLFRQ